MIDERKLPTTELDVEQTSDNMSNVIESLRKELRVTRIINVIVSFLLICMLAGGAFAAVKIYGYVEGTRPLVEKLSAIDYHVLNETMVSLNNTLNEVDWEQMSEQISELDMETLNEALAGLDTEELSATLENLNKLAETLQNFSDSLKSFFSRFGFNNSGFNGVL